MEYSPQEEKIISEAYAGLESACGKICQNEQDWTTVRRAYFLAKEAHKGVRRRSGEPYLLHPIAVARICTDEIGLGVKSVAAALLHDVVEDTEYTLDDIERTFGEKIASMVDGLTKMSGEFPANSSEQAENFRKILLTLSDDVRVILIKIADRLHNMRTLSSMPRDKQMRITGETVYLFAPLAYRLGLYAIKTELEDLCMKYRFPDEYEQIKSKVDATERERSRYIERFCEPIREVLDRNGFKYRIAARVKSVFSIWSKMQRKQIPFEEVYDLFAIRIIFEEAPFPSEKTQCWQIYSCVTDIYAPKPDRLRDWISTPKDNGYEALHSTVMGPDGIWVEVQIRTGRMDELAERGFAAHWKYKQSEHSSSDAFDTWLQKVRATLSNPSSNAIEFLDSFKLSLYTSEITVFTQRGEQRSLPYGATALDFAYDIHTNIGNKAIGAKINRRIAPVTTQLKTGDQVEIITSENAKPKVEWLSAVITAKAKQKITEALKGEQQNNVERGQEMFESALAAHNVPQSGRVLRKVIPAYNCYTKDEFYSKIGAGIISLDNIESVLKSSSKRKEVKYWKLLAYSEDGTDHPVDSRFVIAPCCNPMPGDGVTGVKDPMSSNIIVHKSSCPELDRLAAQHGDNFIRQKIGWIQHKAVSYLASVDLTGIDRIGILLDISRIASLDFSINIRGISINSHDGVFEGRLTVYVPGAESLGALMDKLREVKGIETVRKSLEKEE